MKPKVKLLEEIQLLKSEIEQLRMMNQALTDELDSIYEGQAEVDAIFEGFINGDERRILH